MLFGAGILGMMAANLLNARLVARFGLITLLRIGVSVAALGGRSDRDGCLDGIAG